MVRYHVNVRSPALRGFTLVEMLVVVVLLAMLARVVIGSLSPGDDLRLEVAAGEVRDALRFARAEAIRRQKPTMFDAESSPGRIKVLWLSAAGCSSTGSAATDPRTKSAFVVDIAGGAYSSGVVVTPNFLAGGIAYGGLLFDASGAAADVCQLSGTNSMGTPQAGSNVMLSQGDRRLVVNLDAATGRITGP